MNTRSRILAATIAIFASCGAIGTVAAQTVELTAVEKLYAELAKLSPEERSARILEGAKKEGTLNLVSGLGGKIGAQHTKLFQERYPFLDVQRVEKGAEDGAELAVMEASAERQLTDIYTFSVASAGEVIRRDLTARYPTPAEDKVLPQYRGFLDPEHRWATWIWSEHGISYNSSLLTPEQAPKSWEDLCKPEYKGQVSFDPFELRFVTGLVQVMGEEGVKNWLQCMGKNDPIIQRGHTTRLNLMLAGDHAIQGDNYLYQGMLEKKEHNAPFEPVYTAPLVGYGNGLFINQNANHPYAAALYVDWCFSDESQAYIASQYRNPMTQKSAFIPEDAKVATFSYADEDLAKRLADYWRDYMGAE